MVMKKVLVLSLIVSFYGISLFSQKINVLVADSCSKNRQLVKKNYSDFTIRKFDLFDLTSFLNNRSDFKGNSDKMVHLYSVQKNHDLFINSTQRLPNLYNLSSIMNYNRSLERLGNTTRGFVLRPTSEYALIAD
jgi:hypothetical protein